MFVICTMSYSLRRLRSCLPHEASSYHAILIHSQVYASYSRPKISSLVPRLQIPAWGRVWYISSHSLVFADSTIQDPELPIRFEPCDFSCDIGQRNTLLYVQCEHCSHSCTSTQIQAQIQAQIQLRRLTGNVVYI